MSPEHIEPSTPGLPATGVPLEVTAPFDGAHLATVQTLTAEEARSALGVASDLARDRDVWLPRAERIEILARAAESIGARREGLALAAAREGGKPLRDSLVEADRAADGVRSCVEFLRTQRGSEIPMDLNTASASRFACTTHEPIGVTLAFSAFNHPINLAVHQICTAIAAGCPIVIKPAEATPISCYSVARVLAEAGLPGGWCQVINVDSHESAGALASDPRVNFFSFIGSQSIGWGLRSTLAPGARCALEHGGVAPVVVAADADMDDALPLLAKGAFYHAGQVCVSVQRIYAERAIADELASELARLATELTVGDPQDPGTDVGPLIRPSEVVRVHEWVEEAVDGGARALSGARPVTDTCYAPTVLFDPPADCQASSEEIFGPVVCVYPVDSIDDGIERANALPYAFQSSVFTKNIHVAARCARRLDAAAVMINDHTAFRVDWMPFGGRKLSGLGVGGIEYAIRDQQAEKLVVMRSPEL